MDIETYRASKSSIIRLVELTEERINMVKTDEERAQMMRRLNQVKECISDGDPYLAFDFLVTHIDDLDLSITREIYQEMERFSLLFPTPPEDYRVLCEHIVDE
jgi:hypothetical protein